MKHWFSLPTFALFIAQSNPFSISFKFVGEAKHVSISVVSFYLDDKLNEYAFKLGAQNKKKVTGPIVYFSFFILWVTRHLLILPAVVNDDMIMMDVWHGTGWGLDS